MTRRMTDRELQEIRLRCKAATPGPWRWGCWSTTFGSWEPTSLLERTTLEHYPQALDGSACVRQADAEAVEILTVAEEVRSFDNAVFIMKSRLDVDRLLDEVDRLRGHLRLIQEAWARSWDCSRNPGHGIMEQTMRKIEREGGEDTE